MIDVVIVAKNESRHLGAVLSSLACQENCLEPIRVFVVDNGSRDDTVSIAASAGATVIYCGDSLGKARNAGIKCGTGKFVAFLDGHSVPSVKWASAMLAAFDRDFIGGCMGSIEDICQSRWASIFARESVFSSSDKLWRSTISGLRSTLPWMPTGNCMYARHALEDVGFFTENLFRCEDADLSWKVVLKGYQLIYVDSARVTHFNQSGPIAYLRKYFNYGAGAAELARKYGLQPKPNNAQHQNLSRFILDGMYRIGFKYGSANSNPLPTVIETNKAFRRPFFWSGDTLLALSPKTVFWFPDIQSAICLDLQSGSRSELSDTSLFLFRLLLDGNDRLAAIKQLCNAYQISEAEAAEDIDQFAQQLLNERILIEVANSRNSSTLDKEHEKV